MRINSLHDMFVESINDKAISAIISELSSKTLIVLDILTTGVEFGKPGFQITQLTAVAIDGKYGNIIKSFNEIVDLNDLTLMVMDAQDAAVEYGDIDPDSNIIRHTLNMQDYDTSIYDIDEDDEIYDDDYGEDQDIALASLATWIDSFDNPVIVLENSEEKMRYINTLGPIKLDHEVWDINKLIKLNFVPIVNVLADRGKKHAIDMRDKLNDGALRDIARVLKHPYRRNSGFSEENVRLIASILIKMLKFLKQYELVSNDPKFHMYQQRETINTPK